MPNLIKIRENKVKREKKKKYNHENYTCPNSLKIVSNIIKMNNILLINWVSEYKNLSKEQTEIMMDRFIKINYYCPEKVSKDKFNKKYS